MKPIASLSLDLDNLWSYMKTHGDAGWETFPSYLDKVAPRFLGAFEEFDVRGTVFVVGQDAALPKNREALRRIAEAGHEIANHSYHHEPWLPERTEHEVREEITEAEKVIEEATGQRPRGWRGPSFIFSPTIFRVLAERGYHYDASTFPTFLGPLARAYYFLKSGLNSAQRSERKELFGSLLDGFRSLRPYNWDLGDKRLMEIPVTTMPILRTPIHMSYLLYLATFSPVAARGYLWLALSLCRLLGVSPSMLLHPLDFLGGDEVPELKFFPAMNRTSDWKTEQTRGFLRMLTRRFRTGTMRQHADAAAARVERRHPKLAMEPVS